MAYALFARRKISLTAQLNSASLQQTQRSQEQFDMATRKGNLSSLLSKYTTSLSEKEAKLYEKYSGDDTDLSDANTSSKLQSEIKTLEANYQKQMDSIQDQINAAARNENVIEMEVKRLDTVVNALQKELDAVQEAESGGIDRATPKYSGK